MLKKTGETEKQVIFLRHRNDLDRLKTAILMKKIISLNAADYILKLRNFTRGRLLRMPTIREDDVELIDADVATCFYHSELYYSALRESYKKILWPFAKHSLDRDTNNCYSSFILILLPTVMGDLPD